MTAYERAPDLLWRRTFDRVLILVPGTGDVVTLAGTGVDLWDALVVPRSLGQLATGLAELYETSRTEVEHDVAPVVADLAARGVLRLAAA